MKTLLVLLVISAFVAQALAMGTLIRFTIFPTASRSRPFPLNGGDFRICRRLTAPLNLVGGSTGAWSASASVELPRVIGGNHLVVAAIRLVSIAETSN